MLITKLHIRQFRCFSDAVFHLDNPLIFFEGLNGSGKTSLLEALHYLAYLRSFRTYIPKELIQFGKDNFFIKANIATPLHTFDLQVGFSGRRRLVKMNEKALHSYKELMEYLRVVTITEDDLHLIKGNPEERRFFIDQILMVENPDNATTLKTFKQLIDQRNKLLTIGKYSAESYLLWTEQVWQSSAKVQLLRKQALQTLEQGVKQLLQEYFDQSVTMSCTYKPKKSCLQQTFNDFMQENPVLEYEEKNMGRSLFGAHLDDIIVTFQHKHSKSYASRGQQKLVVLLLKIAHIRTILNQSTMQHNVIFLLDDFMTDFDNQRAEILLTILRNLNVQLIFTVPTATTALAERLGALGGRKIILPH